MTNNHDPEQEFGPTAHGDPMGTPARDEEVLWKGRPDVSLLARTAFHTRSVGIYFAVLIVIAVATGNTTTAVVLTVLAFAALAILYGLAWWSVRTTAYILTDTRMIMRIGMAIETRINVPLKHVTSANLKPRPDGHGDIALELGGERLLGYALLWPHVRPFHITSPQPMLRALPEAERVAALLAETRAEHGLIDVKARGAQSAQDSRGLDGQLEGAPA